MSPSSLQLFQPANVPGDDVSTAGGAKSSTQITNDSLALLWNGFKGLYSGTLNTNAVTIYPMLYVVNTDSTGTVDGMGVYAINLIPPQGAAGATSFLPSSSSDAGKIVVTWGIIAGSTAPTSESVTLGNLATTNGTLNFTAIYRQIVYNSAGTAITTLAGDLQCGASGNTWFISAGESYASGEMSFFAAAAPGDVGTYSNRTVDPTGGSTYVQPTSTAPLYLAGGAGNAYAAGAYGAVYMKLTVQPGMPVVPSSAPMGPTLLIIGDAV